MGARFHEREVIAARRAREPRKHAAHPRAVLWRELKARRILGCDFERSYLIDRYRVDFYCEALALAIEVGAILRDRRVLRTEQRRTARMERLGVTVLRFSDEDVVHNLDGVIASIRRCVRMKAGPWGTGRDNPRAKTGLARDRGAPRAVSARAGRTRASYC